MDERDILIQELQGELALKNESLISIIDYNNTLKGHNEIIINQLRDLEQKLFKNKDRMDILEGRQKVLRRFLRERCDMGVADVDEFINQLKYDAAVRKRKLDVRRTNTEEETPEA